MSGETTESDTILLPPRLRPYLDELQATGLYGSTTETTVIAMLEEQIRNKVAEGQIRARRHGKVKRDG